MLGLLVAALITAPPPAADAGGRVVTVVLGGPFSSVKGEVWPVDRKGKPSSAHEFKGPLEALLRFPSGREFRAVTRSLTVNLTDDLMVRSVYFDLGTAPTWPAIVEVSQQPLIDLGVSAERRDTWKKKLLARPVPFPSYPVEPCVVVGTTMREHGRLGYYLSLEVTLFPPDLWHEPDDWPSCPPEKPKP